MAAFAGFPAAGVVRAKVADVGIAQLAGTVAELSADADVIADVFVLIVIFFGGKAKKGAGSEGSAMEGSHMFPRPPTVRQAMSEAAPVLYGAAQSNARGAAVCGELSAHAYRPP